MHEKFKRKYGKRYVKYINFKFESKYKEETFRKRFKIEDLPPQVIQFIKDTDSFVLANGSCALELLHLKEEIYNCLMSKRSPKLQNTPEKYGKYKVAVPAVKQLEFQNCMRLLTYLFHCGAIKLNDEYFTNMNKEFLETADAENSEDE